MKIWTGIKIGLVAVVAVLLIAVSFWLKNATKGEHVDFGTDTVIDMTPTQIQSIKAIGEWEFLSVSAEELVDTVRKGIFRNDELVRIYYGTLRLGVNMHHVKPGWLQANGDSVTVSLPQVGLLDKDFIDEARTKPFYEVGSWKPADRETLYKKAYRQMLSHRLTKENLQAAKVNGEAQFRSMMRSLGYKHVNIVFE
ncbi:MAG: DUF4230 domain-containing protein [Prevotella sp.]|nr:DUF4230 domain-containing protein [Prevotella sp.]